MKKFISGICATALAATFAVTSIMPVNAAPIFVPRAKAVQDEAGRADVIQVQDGFRYKRRNWNNNSNWNRNNFRRGGNYGWYNGHRGYRYKRYGYRYYNGFWFPATAFIAGAVIGGAIANGNNYAGGNSHVQWCYDRYRSYRASDNTFQPYNGPRQQCYSPYG